MARNNPLQFGYYNFDQAATAPPVTMSIWYRPTATQSYNGLLGIEDSAGSSHGMILRCGPDGQAQAFTNGGSYEASTTGTVAPVGAWSHFAGVWGINNRTAYLNGEAAGINTGTVVTSPLVYIKVGYFWGGSFANGDIAEAAIWNTALTPDEITALAKRVSPSQIRPSALFAYWPLIGYPAASSPEPDRWKNRVDLTTGSALAKADHVPVLNQWHTTVPGAVADVVAQQFQANARLQFSATANLVQPVPIAAQAGLRFSTAAAMSELPVATYAFYAANANKTSGVLIHAE